MEAGQLQLQGGVEGEVAWLADAVRVQAGTGLRVGELAALRWSAVNLSRKTILVGRDELTKSGHQRTVPITGDALAVLTRLHGEHGADRNGFIMHGAQRGRLNKAYYSKRVGLYAERAGLGDDVRSHTLRHVYGAILAEAGVPMFKIQKLMGHESIQTTVRYYGHLSPNSLQDAVELALG